MNAVADVENALVAYSKDGQTTFAYRAAVASYEEALRLSTTSYKEGALSLLDILDAQRSVATAQLNLAEALRTQAQNFVTLNVAIGGGYAWVK